MALGTLPIIAGVLIGICFVGTRLYGTSSLLLAINETLHGIGLLMLLISINIVLPLSALVLYRFRGNSVNLYDLDWLAIVSVSFLECLLLTCWRLRFLMTKQPDRIIPDK